MGKTARFLAVISQPPGASPMPRARSASHYTSENVLCCVIIIMVIAMTVFMVLSLWQ